MYVHIKQLTTSSKFTYELIYLNIDVGSTIWMLSWVRPNYVISCHFEVMYQYLHTDFGASKATVELNHPGAWITK